ncbi:MAG: hypothetical protein KDH96_02700 [Candidatus Riesia sp.]|nr:hypothetical protein [Candidatus Riesia sp.]
MKDSRDFLKILNQRIHGLKEEIRSIKDQGWEKAALARVRITEHLTCIGELERVKTLYSGFCEARKQEE